LRIVFAGTPEFAATALAALIARDAELAGVYTRPDARAGRGHKPAASPVKQLALAHGLPLRQPRRLDEPAELEALAGLRPDVLVVAAYGLLLPPAILEVPRHGCINIHASLLPRWRGAAPIQRAILAGDERTGVSIMQMVPALDAGPVLAQEATPIRAGDDAGTLHERLAAMGARLCGQVLDAIAAGTAQPQPQHEALATCAPKIDKAELELDFAAGEAGELARRVRAFAPRPGCWAEIAGERLRILAARAGGGAPGAAPGTLLRENRRRLGVACRAGVLWLERVQAPGGRPQPAAEFLNGRPALLAEARQH